MLRQDDTADKAGPRLGASQGCNNHSGLTPQELKLRQQLRERRKTGLARKEQVIIPPVLVKPPPIDAITLYAHNADGLSGLMRAGI